jgi:apolipoprotein N-acyltransferase
MSLEEPDRLAFQYLLVELQGARTTALVLWGTILALTVIVFGSAWIVPGLAVFAGLLELAVVLFLWRYSEYPGAIKSAAKQYAFQPSEVNLVEIIRKEVVPKEVRMRRWDSP